MGFKLFAALQFKTVGKFWISGSQRNCIGVFHYCYSDVPVEKDAPWITGQPDNFGGNMDHIYAVISRTNVLVDDEQEKTKFRYICVVKFNIFNFVRNKKKCYFFRNQNELLLPCSADVKLLLLFVQF